jgi:hypothetical protein
MVMPSTSTLCTSDAGAEGTAADEKAETEEAEAIK